MRWVRGRFPQEFWLYGKPPAWRQELASSRNPTSTSQVEICGCPNATRTDIGEPVDCRRRRPRTCADCDASLTLRAHAGSVENAPLSLGQPAASPLSSPGPHSHLAPLSPPPPSPSLSLSVSQTRPSGVRRPGACHRPRNALGLGRRPQSPRSGPGSHATGKGSAQHPSCMVRDEGRMISLVQTWAGPVARPCPAGPTRIPPDVHPAEGRKAAPDLYGLRHASAAQGAGHGSEEDRMGRTARPA